MDPVQASLFLHVGGLCSVAPAHCHQPTKQHISTLPTTTELHLNKIIQDGLSNSTGTTTFHQIFLIILHCYQDTSTNVRPCLCSGGEWVNQDLIVNHLCLELPLGDALLNYMYTTFEINLNFFHIKVIFCSFLFNNSPVNIFQKIVSTERYYRYHPPFFGRHRQGKGSGLIIQGKYEYHSEKSIKIIPCLTFGASKKLVRINKI